MSEEMICNGLGKLVEVQKTVVISTAHISKEDDEKLKKESRTMDMPNLFVDDYGFGLNIKLDEDAVLDEYSEEFRYIYSCLLKSGFDYVKFDCDGPKLLHLKQFEW